MRDERRVGGDRVLCPLLPEVPQPHLSMRGRIGVMKRRALLLLSLLFCCWRCCDALDVAAAAVVVAHRVVVGSTREVDAVRREVEPEDLLHVPLQHLRRRVRTAHD